MYLIEELTGDPFSIAREQFYNREDNAQLLRCSKKETFRTAMKELVTERNGPEMKVVCSRAHSLLNDSPDNNGFKSRLIFFSDLCARALLAFLLRSPAITTRHVLN